MRQAMLKHKNEYGLRGVKQLAAPDLHQAPNQA